METFQPMELPKRSDRQDQTILNTFERRVLLDVFFERTDGRTPDTIPASLGDLYSMELGVIRDYLLNQRPLDPLLHKILNTEF